MGKSCVRFKRLDDIAFDVIAEAFRRIPVDTYVDCYEAVRAAPEAHDGFELSTRVSTVANTS